MSRPTCHNSSPELGESQQQDFLHHVHIHVCEDALSSPSVSLDVDELEKNKKEDQRRWFTHVYYSFTFLFVGLFIFGLLVGSQCVPMLHAWKNPSFREVECSRTGLRYFPNNISCDCTQARRTSSCEEPCGQCISEYPCLLVDVTYTTDGQVHAGLLTEDPLNTEQCYANLSLACEEDATTNTETIHQVELGLAANPSDFHCYMSIANPHGPLVANGVTIQPLSGPLHCLMWPIALLTSCLVWFIVAIVVFCHRHIDDILFEREQLQKTLSSHRSLMFKRRSVIV